MQSQLQSVLKECKILKAESDGHKDRTKTNSETISSLIELEMITSALEQQDEIDRRA